MLHSEDVPEESLLPDSLYSGSPPRMLATSTEHWRHWGRVPGRTMGMRDSSGSMRISVRNFQPSSWVPSKNRSWTMMSGASDLTLSMLSSASRSARGEPGPRRGSRVHVSMRLAWARIFQKA